MLKAREFLERGASVVLRNLIMKDTTNYQTERPVYFYGGVNLTNFMKEGHTYYFRVSTRKTVEGFSDVASTTTLGNAMVLFAHTSNSSTSYYFSWVPSTYDNDGYSGLYTFTEFKGEGEFWLGNPSVFRSDADIENDPESKSGSYGLFYKEWMVIDITDLYTMYPSFVGLSAEDQKKMLDRIPYFIGYKAVPYISLFSLTLKNIAPPTDSGAYTKNTGEVLSVENGSLTGSFIADGTNPSEFIYDQTGLELIAGHRYYARISASYSPESTEGRFRLYIRNGFQEILSFLSMDSSLIRDCVSGIGVLPESSTYQLAFGFHNMSTDVTYSLSKVMLVDITELCETFPSFLEDFTIDQQTALLDRISYFEENLTLGGPLVNLVENSDNIKDQWVAGKAGEYLTRTINLSSTVYIPTAAFYSRFDLKFSKIETSSEDYSWMTWYWGTGTFESKMIDNPAPDTEYLNQSRFECTEKQNEVIAVQEGHVYGGPPEKSSGNQLYSRNLLGINMADSGNYTLLRLFGFSENEIKIALDRIPFFTGSISFFKWISYFKRPLLRSGNYNDFKIQQHWCSHSCSNEDCCSERLSSEGCSFHSLQAQFRQNTRVYPRTRRVCVFIHSEQAWNL